MKKFSDWFAYIPIWITAPEVWAFCSVTDCEEIGKIQRSCKLVCFQSSLKYLMSHLYLHTLGFHYAQEELALI